MRFHIAAVSALALLIGGATATHADEAACQDAVDQYKSVVDDIADAIKSYVACIRRSDGHDDCSTEFSRLRSAQDDFETAVSGYHDACKKQAD